MVKNGSGRDTENLGAPDTFIFWGQQAQQSHGKCWEAIPQGPSGYVHVILWRAWERHTGYLVLDALAYVRGPWMLVQFINPIHIVLKTSVHQETLNPTALDMQKWSERGASSLLVGTQGQLTREWGQSSRGLQISVTWAKILLQEPSPDQEAFLTSWPRSANRKYVFHTFSQEGDIHSWSVRMSHMSGCVFQSLAPCSALASFRSCPCHGRNKDFQLLPQPSCVLQS